MSAPKVNNAGVSDALSTEALTPDSFAKTINTNVRGPLLLVQNALPYIPRGGRIINISSIAATHHAMSITTPIYSASKAALDALTRSWATEFGHSRGITVNSVNPGVVETDILADFPPDVLGPFVEAQGKVTPAAPRIGEADDIAQVVAFLASEGARWVTGSTVSANGGRLVSLA